MSGFYLLGGEGGSSSKPLSSPPKKKFFLKKNQKLFQILILFDDEIKASVTNVRNAISANPEHYLFQNFLGEHAPGPP